METIIKLLDDAIAKLEKHSGGKASTSQAAHGSWAHRGAGGGVGMSAQEAAAAGADISRSGGILSKPPKGMSDEAADAWAHARRKALYPTATNAADRAASKLEPRYVVQAERDIRTNTDMKWHHVSNDGKLTM